MKQRLIILMLIFFSATLLIYFNLHSAKTNDSSKHYAYYSAKEDYGDLELKKYNQIISQKIYGGIVSHHLLANKDIAEFFAEFRDQDIKTIVLIGPNHYGIGNNNILISHLPYETPWGQVNPDIKIINQLTNNQTQFSDEIPFTKEHSISSLVSYIPHNFSGAKIIPIILKSGTKKIELDNLIKILGTTLPSDTIIISSVDFSHHLNKLSANFHDAMSIPVIEDFNYERLFKLEIDSPESIYVLLKLMENKKAQKIDYKQQNAAEIMNDDGNQDVTSYLFAHFIKGSKKEITNISLLNFGNINLDEDLVKFAGSKGDVLLNIKGTETNFLKGTDLIMANLSYTKDKSVNKYKNLIDIESVFIKHKFNFFTVSNSLFQNPDFVSLENNQEIFNNYSSYNIDNINTIFINIYLNSKEEFEKDIEVIKKLNKDNSIIISNIFWEGKHNFYPDDIQKETAHLLIEAGVDLILGQQVSNVQKVEVYNNRAIFYSLGNFITSDHDINSSEGIGVGTIYKDGNYSFYLFPFKILDFKPSPLPFIEENKFCQKLLEDIKIKDNCYFKI